MGKAVILDNRGRGAYTIQLKYNTELRDSRLQALNVRITNLIARLNNESAHLASLESQAESLTSQLHTAIEAYAGMARWCADNPPPMPEPGD